MNSREIRAAFLEFFRSKGHEIVSSSSLIPASDPTLLFTNAGMVQFKSVFLGDEKRPYRRAVSSQKCIRAGGKHNDLENVGYTARHHTFFEMLGNFSFGDYFKRDAIVFAWELLTEWYRLPKDRLWATVYEDDDEAAALWVELTGIPRERVVRLGAKDNFWQMGDTGPCGPCSEIIIDQGDAVGCGKPDCAVGCDCDRYLEIWNLVFMQFDRSKDGTLTPLPKPSIDTGMGLERLSAVLQGKLNNFDTDIFSPIISAICRESGKTYGTDRKTDTAIRVIADHIRSITFLLSEGLIPSNEGRGYVLRRIIRRAARYAKFLDISDPVLHRLSGSVVDAMDDAYPDLADEMPRVRKVLEIEEERFNKTLEHGLVVLNSIIEQTKKSGQTSVSGGELFKLYDTFGFPLDIARDVASEHDLQIDEPGFHAQMEQQKARARASWTAEEAGAAPVYRGLIEQGFRSEFIGYSSLESDATVLAVIHNGSSVDTLEQGQTGEILLDRTPLYAESGGQAGDTGSLTGENTKAIVTDTRSPAADLNICTVTVEKGTIRRGMTVKCSVDAGRRASSMRNHTATHLLHAALRNALGEHVKQAGSYVAADRLRFDFTHFSSLDRKIIDSIEDEINDAILKNIPLSISTMEIKQALESGVTALFGEKYGETVRVVSVPGVSAELCGGTHVRATGDIGPFKILSEGSVASGIRRIEASTGMNALSLFRAEEQELQLVCDLLKVSDHPAEKLKKMLADIREMEKSLQQLRGKSLASQASGILKEAREISGVRVVVHKVDGVDPKDLRNMADSVRDALGSGIALLASVADNQVALLLMVTKNQTARFNAGSLLKEITAPFGGRGGGKADLAQGGIRDASLLDKVFESLYDKVKGQ